MSQRFLLLLFLQVPLVFSLTTINYWQRNTELNAGTVDYYDPWGWNGGYGYSYGQTAGDSSKYTWDPFSSTWKYSGYSACQGQLFDYVNGQPRFLCNCNGGQSYQLGGCSSS